MQANAPSPSGIAISSVISPPSATRTQREPIASANQIWPSASSVQPSGPTATVPIVSAKVPIVGVGASSAHTRRLERVPSSSIVKAL